MKKFIYFATYLSVLIMISGCAENVKDDTKTTSSNIKKEHVSKATKNRINEMKVDSVAIDQDLITASPFIISNPLKIKFNKAELIHITNANDSVKNEANTDKNDFYYIDLEYIIINDTNEMYNWSDFDEIAINNLKRDIESFGYIQSYEINPNISVGPNSIKMIVPNDTHEIKLFPTRALMNNTFTGEEEEFIPEPVIVNFR